MSSGESPSRAADKATKSWIFILGGAVVAAFGAGWVARERLAEASTNTELHDARSQAADAQDTLAAKSRELDALRRLKDEVSSRLDVSREIHDATDNTNTETQVDILIDALSRSKLACTHPGMVPAKALEDAQALAAQRQTEIDSLREQQDRATKAQQPAAATPPATDASTAELEALRREVIQLRSGVQGRVKEGEPNEGMSEATVIALSKPIEGIVGGMEGNSDWFKVVIPRSGNIVAVLKNLGGNKDVKFEDAQGLDGRPLNRTRSDWVAPSMQGSNSPPIPVSVGQILHWHVLSREPSMAVPYLFEVHYTD